MTLSKDYYQEVQEAVRESGDAFMVHNPRLALGRHCRRPSSLTN